MEATKASEVHSPNNEAHYSAGRFGQFRPTSRAVKLICAPQHRRRILVLNVDIQCQCNISLLV